MVSHIEPREGKCGEPVGRESGSVRRRGDRGPCIMFALSLMFLAFVA